MNPHMNANDVDSIPDCSTLFQASNNLIKGSEFNTVRRDMLKVVLNINNNLPDPSHQGGIEERSSASFSPDAHSENNSENSRPRKKAKSSHRRAQFHERPYCNPKVEVQIPTTSKDVGITVPTAKRNTEATHLSSSGGVVLPTVQDPICTVSPINPRASMPGTYSRLMLAHELGYPLYVPEPNLGLPEEYRKKGVRIGDVGRITPSGSFDFLFNICYSPNHPINPTVLPDGFEVLQSFDVSVINNFGPKTFLLSEHVAQTSTSPVTYQCPGPEGAILALPDGSTLFEAQNMAEFQNHAARHAESWYKYMNGNKGRGAPNGALYLVTGCIKSNNWGIASFYPGKSAGNSLRFVPNETTGCHRWETSGRVVARMGPNSQPLFDADDGELNQCTFLSGYKVRLQDDVWESLANEITVPSPMPQHPRPRDDKKWNGASNSFSSATQGFVNNSGSLGGCSNTGSTWSCNPFELDHSMEADLVTEPLIHPSDFINIMLLKSEPNARVAVTHDMEWRNALPKDFAVDNSKLRIEELLRNVSNTYVGMVDKFGCLSLVSFTHAADMEYLSSSRVYRAACDTDQGGLVLDDQASDLVLDLGQEFIGEDVDAVPDFEQDLAIPGGQSDPLPLADLVPFWSPTHSVEDLLDMTASRGQPMEAAQERSLGQERMLSFLPSASHILFSSAIDVAPSFTNYEHLTLLGDEFLNCHDGASWGGGGGLTKSELNRDEPFGNTGSFTAKDYYCNAADGDRSHIVDWGCSTTSPPTRREEAPTHLDLGSATASDEKVAIQSHSVRQGRMKTGLSPGRIDRARGEGRSSPQRRPGY